MQEHISSLMQQREVLLPDVLGHNVQSYLGVNNVILCLLGKQWGVGGGWRKKDQNASFSGISGSKKI